MDISLVKDYLANFQEKELPETVERELRVREMEGKVTSVIGPRRAGKTYYFFTLIKTLERKRTLYLDFEETFLKNLDSTDVLKIILNIFPEVVGENPEYLFLDEIHNVRGWESLVRTLLNRGFRVFVTGSSSRLMSREIATQLRGRALTYLLLPFSFREYLKAKKRNYNLNLFSHLGKLKKDLREYVRFGGFPEVVLKGEGEKILKEYADLAFFMDFVERHEIKSVTLARYVFNHFLQNFSREFSVRSIERKLRSEGAGFNIGTLYRYVEDLEDTLFVFFLRKFSQKAHERELWPRKVYLCDTGLANLYRFSEDFGRLMENVVFLELVRLASERPRVEIFYWKDQRQEEVDFVVKEGMKVKQLIQVTYASGRDEIEKREVKALVRAGKELRCRNLLVITWDYEGVEAFERRKIKFLPLWKWLSQTRNIY